MVDGMNIEPAKRKVIASASNELLLSMHRDVNRAVSVLGLTRQDFIDFGDDLGLFDVIRRNVSAEVMRRHSAGEFPLEDVTLTSADGSQYGQDSISPAAQLYTVESSGVIERLFRRVDDTRVFVECAPWPVTPVASKTQDLA